MADPMLKVDTTTLDQMADGLADARRRVNVEKRKANKDVATLVAKTASARAAGGSPLERRFASAIRPRSTKDVARIAVLASSRNAGANTAFFGTKRRTGWYAAQRYSGSKRQFPEWVGNTWSAGVAGQGPYVINDTIAEFDQTIDGLYANALERALSKAFPGGMS